ncbi:alpha/beta hydrolase [Arthrobacter sp. I2-34]|uniref:Alpha/beta hydrolase n=1 Tax=Arthrobacter hankyongi TaxID=2904801 RepID=A0ABS9L2G6_9MICC|nr:alpha/beta hydrolase [Arthrobacter hankyongi]MCG2620692.1 alpha/beta hydrolase [Arthrobacter hankyongi]
MNDSTTRPHPSHLVFIHGGGVGPWMWRRQLEAFADGFQVHTPVLPGHDPSGTDTYTTHAAAARSIARQTGLDTLRGGVAAIGFSAGGQVAMELAAAYPQRITATAVVSSLVQPLRGAALLGAAAAWAAPLARHRAFARAQARQLSIPDEDFDRYFALSRSLSNRTLKNLLTANFSFVVPAAFLHSSRPALLVAGSKEQRTLVRCMEKLSRELPDARFATVDGAAHGIPLAEPSHLNGLLRSWLAGWAG